MGLIDDPNELVAQNATIRRVAAHNLQIGVTDAGQGRAYSHLTRWRLGIGIVHGRPEPHLISQVIVKERSFQFDSPSAAVTIDGGPFLFEHDLLQAQGMVRRIPIERFHEHLLGLIFHKTGGQHPGD